MDVLELAGRIVFAAIFVDYGFTHLRRRTAMVGFAKSFGAPAAEVTVPLSGVMMLFGGLSVALGVWADAGALLLLAFLVVAAFVAHPYWKETDPNVQAAQRANFWKNISLAGAALFFFALFADTDGELPLTLGGSLF